MLETPYIIQSQENPTYELWIFPPHENVLEFSI